MIDKNIAKKTAGKAAADLIQDGMLVGLGTGTTAAFFIESLIERCQKGLNIQGIPTSERSAKQAQEGGIPLFDINHAHLIDITVDGADEIDHQKRMIKGGGGALLREKIIASMSQEMIVIVDEEKLVKQLGSFPLPVEIVPFAHEVTLYRIQQQGYHAAFRQTPEGKLYVTDNGNHIVDVLFPKEMCKSPERDNTIIRSIPGVVDTGFFFDLAGRVIVGKFDGTVEIL